MNFSKSLIIFTALLTISMNVFANGDKERTDVTEKGNLLSKGFPLTIDHKYGSTTIESQPTRIVSVGYTEHEALLALGVVPIAIRDWYGDYPNSLWPWAQEALGDSDPPYVLSSRELNFEIIASLNPDLIVGVSSGMTQKEYDTLSQIAPVIAQPADYVDYGTPWQVETRIMGQVVGKAEKAEEVVSYIEDRFDSIKNSHPQFQGATAAIAFVFQNELGAYASADSRSRLLTELGFIIPPEYDEIAGEKFYLSFSEERMDLLDTDVIIWIGVGAKGLEAMRQFTLRKTLKATTEGREFFVGKLLGGAFSFASPLSIDYALDELVPALEAAIDGDPETLVPENMR
ncbi:iron-siderophore ABC transporter substrate-binding protein [Spirochaeta cellobiosiphila]|uniref:iron-siderophore ABC transporter substrate-binding protein n=1 Tax=Spirochaeta cellobiosiphila TaxID=504483 RepID=UPI0003F727B3|nr:iron-siderophore ABC transporter substrate-binding protein [Spirochaeta cellobiosiphila]